ncbi:MAG TPA: hypothetical protein VMV49_08100 [Candidatus Deferrimicrobium sp.]|nr:hypothetical protein [Candidatus Deferrimicrobium sp.]
MDEETYTKSLKADIVPIINEELQMDAQRIFSLSIEVLNELFSILQAKSIPIEKLREIITNNPNSEDIMDALKKVIPAIPPVSEPTPVDIPSSEGYPSPVDVPSVSDSTRFPVPRTISSQESIKADIIPVIQNMIDISTEKLFSLSVDTLNQIFGCLENGTIPASEIETILNSSSDSEEISSQLQLKSSTIAPPIDDFKEDLIIGILYAIPETSRAQIEPKLRAIEDINELTEISQLDLPELQSRLGIEVAPIIHGSPQSYDEKEDIRAGILAQLPPSLQGVIGDRINEINDLNRLIKLSQMNYVQIQQELGLATQSPMEIPADILNPVDTASRSQAPSTSPPTTTASPAPSSEPAPLQNPEQEAQLQAQLKERREANQKFIQEIQKIAEKVWKVKMDVQSPESQELKSKIEILYRIHSSRVEKITLQLKNAKNKKRFITLFDWYIFSQRIEEIETYVEHWQGQIQGVGGFRAAINVSRFDPIVEHLETKEIEGINLTAKNALERIHSSDINVRARGVEDIKQISNYLLQKTR